jgi:hypothetical protein
VAISMANLEEFARSVSASAQERFPGKAQSTSFSLQLLEHEHNPNTGRAVEKEPLAAAPEEIRNERFYQPG